MEALQTKFDYNSTRDILIISEYGRHIQKMVAEIRGMEDKEKRQRLAEQVIQLMYQMVPTDKHIDEQLDTLWKHFFRIAGHDIDVTPPPGVNIIPPEEAVAHDKMDYPTRNNRYRHYGQLIQRLSQKVKDMPEGPKREEVITLILSYMKMAYRTWNKEHFINDDLIKSDLKAMSRGTLEATESSRLNYLASKKKKHPVNTVSLKKGKKRKGHSNNRRRRK